MSRWTVAPAGGKAGVKQLVLKGTRAVRGRPPRGEAWLRGSTVSPNEAGVNLRETFPLSRNIPAYPGGNGPGATGQRTSQRSRHYTNDCPGLPSEWASQRPQQPTCCMLLTFGILQRADGVREETATYPTSQSPSMRTWEAQAGMRKRAVL
jgi:hypothetical protein